MGFMSGSIKYILLLSLCSVAVCLSASAQETDRKDVRKGNRDFRKEDYKEAEIDYRKALVKDSTSFAAGYNLGNTLYRMDDRDQAGKIYDRLKDSAPESPYASDYYYNVGNVASSAENWEAAVEAYRQSLLRNPSDMDAKENYVYAKEKLKAQQQNQQQNQQDKQDQQNQDKNDRDRNDEGQDNQDQDRNQDDRQDRSPQEQQGQPKITPQAAQQMLQAIQAKEKETQDKVNKEKAQILKSRQKEKNW